MNRSRYSVFPSAERDATRAVTVEETAQSKSPAYRLAFDDPHFLTRDELRPVRLQLELLKPELIMQDREITSTVVFFGGARIPTVQEKASARTPYLSELSHYYEEARKLAQLIGKESLRHDGKRYVVATGGGPGVMEAGSRGAQEVGAESIGLNIVLPHEQAPNEYVTPELCFNFHYFGIRKMHFLMRARAVTVFPGGYGTLDELFETLTLIQTERMERIPVLLYGEEFWRRIVHWEALADAGTIGEDDLDLFRFVETAEEGWNILRDAEGL